MKNKRTKVDDGNSNKTPQSALQAVFSIIWPLNNWLKKVVFVVVIFLVASFAIWVSLPERIKTEVIGYLKGSNKIQSPAIAPPKKEPSVNIQKDIWQSTEGNQSPAVISDGNVNINIGSQDDKKKNE